VLELAGAGIACGQDGRTEALDMALAIERQGADVMGGDDLTGRIEDDDDAEVRELVITRRGHRPKAVANLLERARPDRPREAGTQGRRA
jgi:hypothetical protein